MKNLLLLLKIHFKNAYNINKFLKTNKKRLVLIILFALYIIVSLFSTFFIYAQSAVDFLSKYNLISYMIVLFYIGATFATFMFTIYNAKSSMFNSNDNDLLLSMPLKSSTILASRLLYITIWNLVTSIFIMLPVYIVYAMNVKVGLTYYFSAFAVFLFLPLIPTILASIIGYIIAYFTSKSNAKNWFELIMSFVLMIIIYVGMAKIGDIMNYLVTHIDNFQNVLKWGFYPVYLVGEIFSDSNMLSLLVYALINITLFVIFIYILSIKFKKIIAKLQENRSKSNYVMKELKNSSLTKALYKKELKRYFSSPIYVFNTSFGVIMLIVLSIVSIFYDKTQILKALDVTTTSNSMFPLMVVALMFIIFMSNTTNSSISIEGRNYWILKTLPIEPDKIFKGKILLNISLIVPGTIISLIVLYFTFGLTIAQLLILIALTIITTFVEAQFGILVNLKLPKMDAVNDVVIVKQSASVLITLLIPLAFIFGMAGLYSAISSQINFNIVLVIVFAILIISYIIERYLLNTWGVRRFKEID